MKLTLTEAREWFQIRDHVKDAVENLEVCSRCWRVRDKSALIGAGRYYCCRPGDSHGCLPLPVSVTAVASRPGRRVRPV